MQRFTISLDDALAQQFDELTATHGYVNRSEAVRDLIREQIDRAQLQHQKATWCVASVSYVYDHHEHTVTERVLALQHDHHDHCLETVVLRGATVAVRACAQQLVALRGVRHGNIHVVPLSESPHGHSHDHAPKARHAHLKPLT